MTTPELLSKLSKKYTSPEYAFLSQVRNQTGYSSSAGRIRTADAMAGMKTGLKLQPAFVEWMMGFPKGWCDFPMEKKSVMPDGGKKP